MPVDPMPAYGGNRYEIALPGTAPATLERVTPRDAMQLGAAFADMEPWLGYRVSAEALASFFGGSEPGGARFAIRFDGGLAGAVVVREPWLLGPYLQFLGLLPAYQGRGLGQAILGWMASEAPPAARQLWLCVTAGNTRACAFYERQGFEHAARLADLVADGTDELLMRRRLRST
ncbi:MAG: GNAT family N-acetyltransferase [Hyphomicrobiaceae bacterium]